MHQLRDVCHALSEIAPLELAESWDNVGLLAGDLDGSVGRIMTCLTLSENTVREAIMQRAELVVSHHPLPFQPLKRITTETTAGRYLWKLLGARIAIYSPHTAWDNSARGINQQTADLLSLQDISPLKTVTLMNTPEAVNASPVGVGRVGLLPRPISVEDVATQLKTALPAVRVRFAGDCHRIVQRVGIVCGSGGSLIGLAASRNCEAFITGEATYHQCLEAEALGMSLILIGHHASERFAMDRMAQLLQHRFIDLNVWASVRESDPITKD